MTCVQPPFVYTVWGDANRIAPARAKGTDGGCPSQAHHQQNPTSDHEPSGPHSYCHAVDVTTNPPVFDPRDYLAAIIARRDARVKYIVANFSGWHGQPNTLPDVICGPLTSWRWEQNGSFKRDHALAPHVHFSFTVAAEQSTAPFFLPEDDMPLTDVDVAKLKTALAPIIREECSEAVRNALGGYVDGKWVDGALAAELRKDHGLSGK